MSDINKNKYIDAAVQSVIYAMQRKEAQPQIYDVIELALYFILNNNRRLRTLEENDNLKKILDNAHYLNYLANKNMNFKYNIQTGVIR